MYTDPNPNTSVHVLYLQNAWIDCSTLSRMRMILNKWYYRFDMADENGLQ